MLGRGVGDIKVVGKNITLKKWKSEQFSPLIYYDAVGKKVK